jgi:hypothetical protein
VRRAVVAFYRQRRGRPPAAAAGRENRVGDITGVHDPAGDDVARAIHASTSPPSERFRLVLRVTGAPQLPSAGCTAASSTALQVEHGQYPHSATAWSAGVTATTMRRPDLGALPPWPRSVACQLAPFGLVHTWTCAVPSEAVKVPPAAIAPACLTAIELPHDPGRPTGDDHEAASRQRGRNPERGQALPASERYSPRTPMGREETAGRMLAANCMTPPRSGRGDSHPDGSTQRLVDASPPPGTPTTYRPPSRFTPGHECACERRRAVGRGAPGLSLVSLTPVPPPFTGDHPFVFAQPTDGGERR